MDTKQLEESLKPFIQACADKGYPIDKYCVVDSLRGLPTDTYNLQIKSSVINQMGCSDALEVLIDILFDTTTSDLRESIFYIQILNDDEDVACFTAPAAMNSSVH